MHMVRNFQLHCLSGDQIKDFEVFTWISFQDMSCSMLFLRSVRTFFRIFFSKTRPTKLYFFIFQNEKIKKGAEISNKKRLQTKRYFSAF